MAVDGVSDRLFYSAPKQNPHGPAVPVGVTYQVLGIAGAMCSRPLWAYGAQVGGGGSRMGGVIG